MGQANLPMLNRAGESTFWASSNENFINYARGFSEGFFFQTFFAFILSNKAHNFFFFTIFYRALHKINCNPFMLEENIRTKVLVRLENNIIFKKKAKSLKKTFKFSELFFSKVFLYSFYKCLIVTIKAYNRIVSPRQWHSKYELKLNKFFWKICFANYCNRIENRPNSSTKSF